MCSKEQIEKRIEKWLNGPFDLDTKKEIKRLRIEDPEALFDAFSQELSFGTGGLRNLMGIGTNRINIYTIRKATQGLANYLKKQNSDPISVFIGYDTRKNSREFAIESARVLAGNQIEVFISESFCPTPLVSFACRHLKCSAAIMITASHNPPEYNGYKVYWSDGGQVVPPHDIGIIQEVTDVQEPILEPVESEKIHWINHEVDAVYFERLKTLHLCPEIKEGSLKIIYTSLHGTGIRMIPKALQTWGYDHISFVGPQIFPDETFPNAPSPNPEEKKTLEMGTSLLMQDKADLLIATDPDADRMGIVIRHHSKAVTLTGHQIACLCLYHICSSLKEKNKMPPSPVFIKTIVTTELFKKIALSFDAVCIDVLTGFKYISEKIHDWEKNKDPFQFLFGAEESYGYLFGTFVRDKDAISASCLMVEIAAKMKQEGKTVQDFLYMLYQKYGIHRESLKNIHFPNTQEGMKKIEGIMKELRKTPPSQIQGKKVVAFEDYLSGAMPLPPSNVLRFWLEDGTKLVVRPSGTEPKVKLYAEVVKQVSSSLETDIQECDTQLNELLHSFRLD